MRYSGMLVLNHRLCNKLLGHIPILSPGGGCLGHCLEQECKAVTGLDGIGDLLVMSAIGTGGAIWSYLCCTLPIPGELYIEYSRT